MTTPDTPALPVDLAEVREQFAAWRSTRPTGGRIPDHLWALAIGLLSSYSAPEVARQLGLHPERLRRRHSEMARRDPKPRSPRAARSRHTEPPPFLELVPDARATHAHRTGGDLRLVIECPDGTRISLASETSDWGRVETLVRSLIAR
jgi:hypothetical protein